ncbi:conjugal transfer protein (plasmid) [Paracoccus liaowanqingii]|uniref:Conjugal transfer protein n=1 Tax=Paracoccus liaowanqingii TaxID=2560053 RepID=A0A4Y5SRA3_9RHOB|nr:TrbI/VirB10 family protein [Paracoccus liaowanqingii]QDA36027.1 conjugal transfer protein [Paracoccus liaowanqingii]
MSDQDSIDLRERLSGLEKSDPKAAQKARPAANAARMTGLLCGGALIAGLVYVYSQPEGAADLDVSRASEFQREGSGFGDLDSAPRLAPGAAPEPVLVAAPDTTPAPAPVNEGSEGNEDSELANLIRGLQDQIDRLSDAPAEEGVAEPIVDTEALEQMRGELEQLREEAQSREQELRDALSSRDLQIAGLNNQMDMMRLQSGQSVMPGSNDDLLTQRRQSADEAAQLEQARRQSSMVALGGGGGGAAGAGAGEAGLGDGAAAQQAARLSSDAQFVRDAGRPVQVQRAEIIVNPSNTVTQGTMIQAVLETAIDSTLEGPIRGLVTTDVVAYDSSRILIPRGSRLIGSYSADVNTGQNRLLVAWERIIMPDDQSVQISSFGGDALGRSGTTGRVNNHFVRRFGAAALISTISAIPSALQDNSSDGGVTISTGGSNDLASGVTDALSGATNSAIGKYVSMPPTISVAQGTRITVMVDRDLEIF